MNNVVLNIDGNEIKSLIGLEGPTANIDVIDCTRLDLTDYILPLPDQGSVHLTAPKEDNEDVIDNLVDLRTEVKSVTFEIILTDGTRISGSAFIPSVRDNFKARTQFQQLLLRVCKWTDVTARIFLYFFPRISDGTFTVTLRITSNVVIT